MKDMRLQLLIAAPAALALLGVIWLYRKKSTTKVKRSESDKRNKQGEPSNQDGVTLTQRKIPETMARDRGSSDLSRAPDSTGGRYLAESKMVSDLVSSAIGSGLMEAGSAAKNSPKQNRSPPMPVPGVKEVIHEDNIETVMGTNLPQTGDSFPSPEDMSKVRSILVETSDATVSHSSGKLNKSASDFSDSSEEGSTHGGEVAEEGGEDEQTLQAVAAPKLSSSCDTYSTRGQIGEARVHNLTQKRDQSVVSVPDQGHTVQPSSSSNVPGHKPSTIVSVDVHKPSPCDLSQNTDSLSSGSHNEDSATKKESFQSSGRPMPPCSRYSAKSSPSPQLQVPMSPVKASATELGCSMDSGSVMDDLERMSSASPCAATSGERVHLFSSSASQDSVVGSLEEGRTGSVESPALEESEAILEKEQGKRVAPTKSGSPLCDNNSEGSNDSGQGGSEHDSLCPAPSSNCVNINFNMPSDLCGRLIGKHGKNINYIKSKSGAEVSLVNNPFTSDFQICHIFGGQSEVEEAMNMIRRKFPVQDYPNLTMAPLGAPPLACSLTESSSIVVSNAMQLSLPEGVSVEVLVCAIVSADHVFVQQPTHQSFMGLEKLTMVLNNVYSQEVDIPSLPTPVKCGDICVVESEGGWYRAITSTLEDEEGYCTIKFVDYGGYLQVHSSSLKQIRMDFMTLPFQAVECYMANIIPPNNEEYFREEAVMALSEMTDLKLLQCQVVARAEDGTPYIHLYQADMAHETAVNVNEALVKRSLAQWVEML